MNIFKKTKKFIKTPGIFFRDYFNKHYPLSYTELRMSEDKEIVTLLGEYNSQISVFDNQPIDVVYTWVNNTDLIWQERYQYYKMIYESQDVSLDQFSMNDARFEDHKELYFSIKSIKVNMPWVRYIYLVTDNQIPEWINEYPDVIIVYHEKIIDKQYLPTFNSHVIEAFLHKIPNLSENFLYFNDDVFVAKPLEKSHFFAANGLASLFVSAKKLEELQIRGLNTSTLSACLIVKQLLEDRFNVRIDNTLVHTYYPLKKSVYQQAWSMFENEILRFLPNKFRTNNDLNLATFLVPWLMYCQGQAFEKLDVCYYFNIRSRTALSCYNILLRRKKARCILPHSFCANDFCAKSNDQVPDYKDRLISFLNKYYV